ncbi:hypothetical protein BJ875DRAFT_521158 [Amylocarpus encephaloides]|uniref:Uncharacterized protein n=1 Tax=Amylocarpus encephaloides TaxID=45428 RepID=A0A9P7YAE5_9HELO|nr:hypothetical protein BJ875DRAFT_521158 [Amylocarpus encephaloides]
MTALPHFFNSRRQKPYRAPSRHRQIFAESRHLPFQMGEFVFVNWFWSELFAARQFTRGLRAWQGDAVRPVGLEVGGRRIGVWGGMRGWWVVGCAVLDREGIEGTGIFLDVNAEWMREGLMRMRWLRCLDLEIQDQDVG